MKIEWGTWRIANVVGYTASAGLVELNVTSDARGWTIGVYNADTSETFERVEGFAGTLDEAKQQAVALAMRHFEPFTSIARAAEREACAQIALDRAAQFGRLALDAARDGALSVEVAIRARSAEGGEQ